MSCKPEDAGNYDCCVFADKKCSGKKCMAWAEEVSSRYVKISPGMPMVKERFNTGNGYCLMAIGK